MFIGRSARLFQKKEMSNKAVEKDPCLLAEVPDHFKAEEIYEKVAEDDP